MFVVHALTLVACLGFLENHVHCTDEPLLLTPYIEEGKIEEAQSLAKVTPNLNGWSTSSGYITVNKECGTHWFFWYVNARRDWGTAPIFLVIDGGSALTQMFGEIGPFKHLKNEGFITNEYGWVSNNLIFLDQPAGTGFSFSEKGCHAENMNTVASETYTFLAQFRKLFPTLRGEIFIVGQSYAAKFIIPMALEIDAKNKVEEEKINLKGIILGNPTLDPVCAKTLGYLHALGVLDSKQFEEKSKIYEDLKNKITQKDFVGARELDKALNLVNIGLPSFYDVTDDPNPSFKDPSEFQLYVRSMEVRKQIHVGNTPYNKASDPQYNFLDDDIFNPSTEGLKELAKDNKYIIGIYTGQLNARSEYGEISCVLQQASPAYLDAPRKKWYVNGRLAGWVKVAGNVFEVVFRGTGASVLSTHGEEALKLITAAVAEKEGAELLSGLDLED